MDELKLFEQVEFEINWDKIKTVEDVIVILKALKITINYNKGEIPVQFEEMMTNDFLKPK